MKHIPSRTPQIVFIGPNYYVKHICMKENLDPILEHQIKCESMKACKELKLNTWEVHFNFKVQMLSRSKRIPQVQSDASILLFIQQVQSTQQIPNAL